MSTSIEKEATAVPAQVMSAAARLAPLDATRGLIMVVMALDHANVFIAHAHPLPEMWTGPFPSYDSALAFLTRFVTHLAAPGFFFLMGAGIVLFASARRNLGWTHGAIVRHLIVRGGILIALQLLVENRAWALGGPFPSLYFGVLYGLGATMIAAALFLQLNSIVLAASSLASLLLTYLAVSLAAPDSVSIFLRLMLLPGSTGAVTVYYPVVPWLGLAGFGMVFGRWLLQDRARAYRRALWVGFCLLVLFFVVRAWGGFGNIRPPQGGEWIAFLNVVKYPPSLVFILLTLGTDLTLLGLFARVGLSLERWARPLIVLGSSALFFYLAHLYLYALIGLALGGRGISIAAMYPYWILGLVVLTPLCWLYGKFKHAQPSNSLLRFF